MSFKQNDYRKCAKCGKTRAEDMTVSYHRFPNPGISNMDRASAWAKYCYPTEDWSSLEFLQSLYRKNKVLCGRHFHSSKFYDNMRQKLSKFAVPDSDDFQELSNDQENLFTQAVFVGEGSSQTSSSVENFMARQTTDVLPATTQQTFVTVESKQNVSETKGTASSQPLSSLENLMDPQITDVLPATVQKALVAFESKQRLMQSSDGTTSVAGPSKPLSITTTIQPASMEQISKTGSCIVQKSKVPKKKSGILKQLNVTKKSQLTPREIKLYGICQKKLRQVNRLRKELKNKKTKTIEKLVEDENVRELYNLKISNSFVTLLQSQLKNCPKKPRGRRYSINQKLMALVIYKKSPACYRLLRRMFALPSQSCLNKLLNRVPLKPGINNHIFDSIKKMAESNTSEENICLLLFDEMSIRKHLHYDSRQDLILGYQDHGNHGRSQDVATKALVFMLVGLRKKWKQPIAFYFTHALTADRMTVILKEILSECNKAKVDVVGTVCDLSTVNIKSLKTLGATTRAPYFKYIEKEYVAILDPPHLLKCTRNLFLKHDVECTTDFQANNLPIKGIAKWSHLESFYNLDKNNLHFVYAPALTDQHIHPNLKQQMRVKLAVQVFSHSVAAGILAKIASNDLPTEAHATANFVKKFDDLFDAVNADTPDLRRGKKYATNMTAHSPHIELFNTMRKFISSMKYIGARSKPASQDGWIHTLNSIERLWKNVQSKNIKSISTRRLNQDPLENCFGCIRYSCGSNANPTIQQFVAGVKTAIITNLRHTGQKKNCEDDNSFLFNNLESFLLSNIEEEQQHQHVHVADSALQDESYQIAELEKNVSDAVETVDEATPEGQACAYVSGFIFKKLKHDQCEGCQKVFLCDVPDAIHIFTSLREYNENNALKYVNKNVVVCVEQCATIINNYLKCHASETQLKLNIMNLLGSVDFSFLSDCAIHLEKNIAHIKISAFAICIKRYIILRNREMEEDEKNKALERKIKVLKNK